MITRFANLSGRMAITLAFLFGIAACGGGGGGGNNDVGFLPPDGGSSTTYKIELAITDANGDPTSSVTATKPATLTAKVTRKNNPVAGVVATATGDIGEINPATALTDSDGVATFQVTAGDNTLGAGTIEVSVDSPDEGEPPFTQTISFQVGSAGLRLGHFEDGVFMDGVIGVDSPNLATAGTALLRIDLVDEDGEPSSATETINLTSGCAANGLAELAETVQAVNGTATTTYTATGCSGSDQVTATLAGNAAATAQVTISVASPEADVIEFVSAAPTTIALRGTGSSDRPEKSTVVFRVISGENSEENPGTPLSGIPVNFSLSTQVGGLTLQNSSATTDANGQVKAVVQSGSAATTVRVTARIETESGQTISTTSDPIVVSTGLPDQNSMSLSSQFLNVPSAREIDGVTSVVTVRMADRFNNPVPDGTTVFFTTEYGAIDDSCITGESNGIRYTQIEGEETPVTGVCSVIWISQSPRFPLFQETRDALKTTRNSLEYDCRSHNGIGGPCPNDLGGHYGLRSTILVTSIGEESFVDENGNGLYDEGEPFENLPEAFVDHNEDGQFTPVKGGNCALPTTEERCVAGGAEETFEDFNQDGEYSDNVDPNTGEGLYNGSLCPVEGDGIWCSRELIQVRDDIVLIIASENPDILLVRDSSPGKGDIVSGTFEGRNFLAYIADGFNNLPGAEVEVTVAASGDCSLETPASFTVPNTNAKGAFTIPVRTTGSGTLEITAGNTSAFFTCEAPEENPDCDISPQPPGC